MIVITRTPFIENLFGISPGYRAALAFFDQIAVPIVAVVVVVDVQGTIVRKVFKRFFDVLLGLHHRPSFRGKRAFKHMPPVSSAPRRPGPGTVPRDQSSGQVSLCSREDANFTGCLAVWFSVGSREVEFAASTVAATTITGSTQEESREVLDAFTMAPISRFL